VAGTAAGNAVSEREEYAMYPGFLETIPPEFPTIAQLRHGIILGSLLRVVSTPPGESPSDTYTWNGEVLEFMNYGGMRGCIAFTQDHIVGAFFWNESDRNFIGDPPPPGYDAMDYFAMAPPEVQAIARQHFLTHIFFESYMGEYANFSAAFDQGTEAVGQFYEEHEQEFAPVITAAFWSEGERLTAGEPWPAIYYHGAHLLRDEFSEAEAVLSKMVKEQEFPPEHAELTLRLYQRRLATNTLPMM
jgi:hypothetical protein